eukprot:IDg13647t1
MPCWQFWYVIPQQKAQKLDKQARPAIMM